MWFCTAAFVLIYGAGLLLTSLVSTLGVFADTLILGAVGGACLLNFRRNRTVHCGITGPIVLLGAVAAALIEAGVWRMDMAIVWGVVLLGAGVAFAIEWRTVRRERARQPSAT